MADVSDGALDSKKGKPRSVLFQSTIHHKNAHKESQDVLSDAFKDHKVFAAWKSSCKLLVREPLDRTPPRYTQSTNKYWATQLRRDHPGPLFLTFQDSSDIRISSCRASPFSWHISVCGHLSRIPAAWSPTTLAPQAHWCLLGHLGPIYHELGRITRRKPRKPRMPFGLTVLKLSKPGITSDSIVHQSTFSLVSLVRSGKDSDLLVQVALPALLVSTKLCRKRSSSKKTI